jgi:hypothetical protein
MAAVSIQDHLKVVLRLAKRDPSAFAEIASTPAAFWFSFRAALFSLPFMLVTLSVDTDAARGVADGLAEVALFAVGWLLFPAVMLEVVPVIKRTEHYCRYIAASNWCRVLEDGVLTLIVLMRALNILPESASGLMFFAAVIWVFSFQFFVVRHGLRIDTATAALIIGLRLMLSVGLFIASSVLGG